MNAMRSFTVTLLISLSCTQLACMHQPRALEKQLLQLQKALSQNKQKHINHAWRILKKNPELVTAYFRGRPIAHAAQTAAAVKLLASHRADFNQVDRFGNTALHNAQNSATTLALLIAGMDANVPNSEGQTALFFAHSARQVEVLIQCGADINALDNFGRSALYYARSGGVAKALIKAGANLDIEDENGRTPGQVLIHTNPEAARHVEFFLKRQAEKKEIRQQRASKKPTMVWRAKPKPIVAVETEQKASKFDALVIPALIIEQLESEAMQEEAEIQEVKLTEQKIIQNSTPIAPQTPAQSQAQMPTDPLARFAQENPFAVLQDNAATPLPEEEHIEYVPQVHTTIHHVTPTDIPNSTPIIAPHIAITEVAVEHKAPAPSITQPTTTINNATEQEHFSPFATTNYFAVLQPTTPEPGGLR